MITNTRLRRELAAYRQDLLWRVLQVACPRCKAKPCELCSNQRGHKTSNSHWVRHNEAKRVGILKGRWFDCKKWGVEP